MNLDQCYNSKYGIGLISRHEPLKLICPHGLVGSQDEIHCPAKDEGQIAKCVPCGCDLNSSTSLDCQFENGRPVCQCKPNFRGDSCVECQPGYHSYPTCLSCACNPRGTHNFGNYLCDINTGQCPCQHGYGGRDCNSCLDGFYGEDCQSCGCDASATERSTCDEGGRCVCKEGFQGDKCESCQEGYFGDECSPCGCLEVGSDNPGTCNHYDGQCACKDGFSGRQCKNRDCKEEEDGPCPCGGKGKTNIIHQSMGDGIACKETWDCNCENTCNSWSTAPTDYAVLIYWSLANRHRIWCPENMALVEYRVTGEPLRQVYFEFTCCKVFKDGSHPDLQYNNYDHTTDETIGFGGQDLHCPGYSLIKEFSITAQIGSDFDVPDPHHYRHTVLCYTLSTGFLTVNHITTETKVRPPSQHLVGTIVTNSIMFMKTSTCRYGQWESGPPNFLIESRVTGRLDDFIYTMVTNELSCKGVNVRRPFRFDLPDIIEDWNYGITWFNSFPFSFMHWLTIN